MPRANVVRLIAASLSCGLLVAAATAPPSNFDVNLARLKSMPAAERERLAAALARFDSLPEERRAAIRKLDEELGRLDPDARADYLVTLRRYALWFQGLPEKDRAKIRNAPDDSARAAMIDKLRAKEHPPGMLPLGDLSVPFGDLGLLAPIEMGNLVRVWTTLTAQEKKRIEAIPARRKQVQELSRIGRLNQVPFQVMPAAEEEAILKRLEASPLAKAVSAQAKLRQGKIEEGVGAPLAKKKAFMNASALFRPLHHLVESIHFQERPPRSVDPADLARFEASLPIWMRESLDPLPPAEARRRLTIVYRQVYPHPAEMPRPKAAESAKAAPKKAAAPVPTPAGDGEVTPF